MLLGHIGLNAKLNRRVLGTLGAPFVNSVHKTRPVANKSFCRPNFATTRDIYVKF
jgi:hypothetical protein